MAKSTEKTCPSCAEKIKIEAALCKHCRHEFSAIEIALAKEKIAEASIQRNIDKQLRELHDADSVRDLEGEQLTREDIEEIAQDLGCALLLVEARAVKHKMSIDEIWDTEKLIEIDAALRANNPLHPGWVSEIANQLNVHTDQLFDRAQVLKISFASPEISPASQRSKQGATRAIIIALLALIGVIGLSLFLGGTSGDSSSKADESAETSGAGTYQGGTATASEREAYSRDLYDRPSGMSGETKRRYESSSPQAQEYVDEQMAKYDAACAHSSEC